VDTLEELRRRLPGAELFFIVGEDSVPELPGWRDVPGILRRARVVAVNRPGHAAQFRAEDFSGVPPETIARLEADRVTMDPSSCQSREIRERLRRGASVAAEVPAPVLRYILEKGLYGARREAP
jgi:nicotinate-nucleotide adenylyltransferase